MAGLNADQYGLHVPKPEFIHTCIMGMYHSLQHAYLQSLLQMQMLFHVCAED